MAASAFTTDLTTIHTGESGQAAVSESSATGWADGGTIAVGDTDNYIQGAAATSQALKSGVGSMLTAPGGTYALPTDGAFLVWQYHAAPATLDVETNGGIRLLLGNSLTAFYGWKLGGRDSYTYGGWQCLALNPAWGAAEYTAGAPSGTYTYVGLAHNQTGTVNKGSPCWMDTIRYGRGEFRTTGGDAGNGYGTFALAATTNDNTTNRYGLLQAIEGGYKQQGLFLFGASSVATTNRARSGTTVTLTVASHTFRASDVIVVTGVGGTGYNGTWTVTSVTSTTVVYTCATNATEGTTADTGGTIAAPCDFRSSNTSIVIANVKRVTANFNTFEVRGTGSRVDLTNISFSALGTLSRGRWVTTDDADINIDGCVFTDMGTFGFKSLSTINTTTFRRTDQITQSSAYFDKCIIDNSRASSAILSDNPTRITNCTFISDGTGHGIEITTAGTYDLTGNTFSGYSTANPGSNLVANSGSTDAMIYNNSGGEVTLNLLSGTNPTVRNGLNSTTTVVQGNKTVTLTGLKNPSEVRVFDAGTTTERPGTGAEDVIDGDHSFTVPSGTAVDISILSLGYQNLRILNFSTTSDTTIPISQVIDRQYFNP